MADAARGAEDWMGIPTAGRDRGCPQGQAQYHDNWYADTPLDDDAGLLGANMQFPIQNAGAIVPFPTVAGTAVFAPGVWAVADGGELDFGVTRDAASNAANNYAIMSEIFETGHVARPRRFVHLAGAHLLRHRHPGRTRHPHVSHQPDRG